MYGAESLAQFRVCGFGAACKQRARSGRSCAVAMQSDGCMHVQASAQAGHAADLGIGLDEAGGRQPALSSGRNVLGGCTAEGGFSSASLGLELLGSNGQQPTSSAPS